MSNAPQKILDLLRPPPAQSGSVKITDREPPTKVAETITDILAIYVGPHTARVAVKTFSQGKLGCEPALLGLREVPQLLAALRPMLRTLLGHSQCQILIHRIEEELAL